MISADNDALWREKILAIGRQKFDDSKRSIHGTPSSISIIRFETHQSLFVITVPNNEPSWLLLEARKDPAPGILDVRSRTFCRRNCFTVHKALSSQWTMPPNSAQNEELGTVINEGADENLAELRSEQAKTKSSLSTKAELGNMSATFELVSDTLKGLVARLGDELKEASATNAANLGSAQEKLVTGSLTSEQWKIQPEFDARCFISRNFFICFSQLGCLIWSLESSLQQLHQHRRLRRFWRNSDCQLPVLPALQGGRTCL